MKYFKDILVGKTLRSSGDYLAFVRPVTKDLKKDQKSREMIRDWLRQKEHLYGRESVEAWIERRAEPLTQSISNRFEEGFKVVGYSNRHSTSNKHIEILHPYGFVFEVSVENFTTLLGYINICDGYIKTPCCLCFNKTQVNLVAIGTEMWDSVFNTEETPLSIEDLEVGDMFTPYGEATYTYLGERTLSLSFDAKYTLKSGEYKGFVFLFEDNLLVSKKLPFELTKNNIKTEKGDFSLMPNHYKRVWGSAIKGSAYYYCAEEYSFLGGD